MLATEALKILKRKGLRMTPQRQAIVAEVMRSKGHISATVIAARVQSRMPGVTPSTIYRTLDVLENVGLLSHSHLERGAEYHHAAESGHVHLTCSRCHRVVEVEQCGLGSWLDEVSSRHGFVATDHRVEITGLCASCR